MSQPNHQTEYTAPPLPDRTDSKGKLITIEGGDGGGKTSQMLRLAARLEAAGKRVRTTREPGGTPTAEAVRQFLLSGAGKPLGPDGEAVLFAAARADHVTRLIRPALDRGEWVLCDRFIDSTRAYQGAAGVDPTLIEALERITVWPTEPALTIILDVPVELGLLRANARAVADNEAPDRFEQDAVSEQQRRRDIFRAIAAKEPSRCIVIDASRPETDVAEAIWRTVRDRFSLDENPTDA
ncbi:MAG: dTMP kinase [Alphaproteobacteria bacterium]